MENVDPDLPSTLEGKLLLADPTMRGGVFERSVILLAEHNKADGAFGLVLNHPSGQMVGELLSDKEFAPLAHVQVHVGGPVSQGHMTFAAFWEEGEKFRYATRISATDAIGYAHRQGTLVRAFVGYSGWTKNQLEEELEGESWFTSHIPKTILGETHDRELWKKVLKGMSPYHRIIASAPENILAN
ncbi:MAG: YqgE/AlgH family protein [Verrucomicrobiaceae bacterium]